MGVILIALGVAIVAYVVMNILFPGLVAEDRGSFTRQAIERLYNETSEREDASERDVHIALRNQLEDELPWIRLFYGTPLTRPMYEALVRAGFREQALGVSFGAIAGACALSFLFFAAGFGIASPLVGVVAAYALTYVFCMRRVRKRNLEFLSQFPDVLDMVVRSMRAGFPVNTAIQMVADNMENPSRAEFRYVLNDIGMGRSLNQALSRLCARVDEQDVRFFAVMVAIQQETGGNLAEVLQNLSKILRQRKQLRDKLRALTSEGRATGWILSGLPVFVFCVLYVIQRDYLEPLWLHPLGQVFFATSIGLVVLCQFIIRKMIAIEI